MDPRVRIVVELDNYAAQSSNNVNLQESLMQRLDDFSKQEDALSYVPVIFSNASMPILALTAVKIINNHISCNWEAIPEENQEELKHFVLDALSSSNYLSISKQLENVLAKIAIKNFPEKWNTFISDMVSSSPPRFGVLTEFLYILNNSDALSLSISHSKALFSAFTSQMENVLVAIIENLPGTVANQSLISFLPFLKWESMKKINIEHILSHENIDNYGPLCSLMCINDVPLSFVENSLVILSKMEIENDDVFKLIIPVLEKHIVDIEKTYLLALIHDIHARLSNLDFYENIDYWENFILTIYDDYKKKGSSSDRYTHHFEVLGGIRSFILRNMVQPYDFYLPGEEDSSQDQDSKLLFERMRSILIALLDMSPSEVFADLSSIIDELRSGFDQTLFLSMIWSIACITGSTGSVIESVFVIDSLKFILDAYKLKNIDKAVIATCFLFLSSSFAKAQVLTPQFIDVAINLSLQGLINEKIQKMSSYALNSITKYCTQMITTIPNMRDLILFGSLSPGMFTSVIESAARIYNSKKRLGDVNKMLVERYDKLKDAEIDFAMTRNLRLVLCGFIGIARIDSGVVFKVVDNIRESLEKLAATFSELLINLVNSNGSDAVHREDSRLMLGFLKSLTVLYKEIGIKNCELLFKMYMDYPFEIRKPEMLVLAESILKTELKKEEIGSIRTFIIEPTEQMIKSDPDHYLDFAEYIPRILSIIIRSAFDMFTESDVDYLLEALRFNHKVSVLGTIQALESFLDKADRMTQGQERVFYFQTYFIRIIFELLVVITEPSHRFCFREILAFITKLFMLIRTERLSVNLFDDNNNIDGTIKILSNEICQVFSNISHNEMVNILSLLISSEKPEEIEELIIMYISRVRQTSEGETLKHLKIQKIKSISNDLLNK